MQLKSVVLILLLCGCIGLFPVSAESTEIPNLVGNWTGISAGYSTAPNAGFFNESSWNLSIVAQHGQVLNGTIAINEQNYQARYVFSGIIDHDMTTLYMAENGTGMDVAHLISPTEIEFIGLGLSDGSSVIVNFTKET